MTAGRPAKPIEQHKRTGTYRKDRHGDSLATVAALPGPAPILDVSLVEAVERILDQGVTWLGVTDSPSLVLLRDMLEERQVLREAVMAGAGDRRQLRELDKQVSALFGRLGFDPAARARLGLAEVTAASKLAKLRQA